MTMNLGDYMAQEEARLLALSKTPAAIAEFNRTMERSAAKRAEEDRRGAEAKAAREAKYGPDVEEDDDEEDEPCD